MNARDLFRLVLSNLNRMRGRVIMTAMGVLIGTASIVVLIALASGLQENATSSLMDIGPLNQITVFPSMGFQMGMGGPEKEARLTTKALRDIERIDGVVAVTPYESFYGSMTLKFNRLEGFSNLVGIDPRAVSAMKLDVIEGSNRLGRWTVLAGSRVAESFIDPRRPNYDPNRELPDIYGQTLVVELERVERDGKVSKRTIRMRVGGVLEEIGGSDDTTIFMAMDDMEEIQAWAYGVRADRKRDGYNQARVIVEDPARVVPIEYELADQGYFAYSARSILQSINVLFLIIQAVLGGIGAIALLVAAIGIANTMIMSILERTREIGLMKAVGATNRDVMSVFVTEAGVIGLLGGIAGVLFGFGASKVIDIVAMSYINAQTAAAGGAAPDNINITNIPLWLPVFAIVFSIVIGLAAGIYPALRAVQLNPVTALKYE